MSINQSFQSHQAYQQQAIEAIASLIAQNVDVNSRDQNGLTPLFHAVEGGFPEVVKALILFKANVNLVYDSINVDGDRTTVLHEATHEDQIEILSMLLQAKADVTQRDTTGCSALHLAVMSVNEKAVMLLLEQGAHPDMRDHQTRTPLHFVASDEARIMDEKGMEETIETLISTLVNANADINALDEDSDTPLALLAKKVEEREADWCQPSWPGTTCLSLVSRGAEIPDHFEGRVLELLSPLPISQLRLFMVELNNQKRQKPDS